MQYNPLILQMRKQGPKKCETACYSSTAAHWGGWGPHDSHARLNLPSLPLQPIRIPQEPWASVPTASELAPVTSGDPGWATRMGSSDWQLSQVTNLRDSLVPGQRLPVWRPQSCFDSATWKLCKCIKSKKLATARCLGIIWSYFLAHGFEDDFAWHIFRFRS